MKELLLILATLYATDAYAAASHDKCNYPIKIIGDRGETIGIFIENPDNPGVLSYLAIKGRTATHNKYDYPVTIRNKMCDIIRIYAANPDNHGVPEWLFIRGRSKRRVLIQKHKPIMLGGFTGTRGIISNNKIMPLFSRGDQVEGTWDIGSCENVINVKYDPMGFCKIYEARYVASVGVYDLAVESEIVARGRFSGR